MMICGSAGHRHSGLDPESPQCLWLIETVLPTHRPPLPASTEPGLRYREGARFPAAGFFHEQLGMKKRTFDPCSWFETVLPPIGRIVGDIPGNVIVFGIIADHAPACR